MEFHIELHEWGRPSQQPHNTTLLRDSIMSLNCQTNASPAAGYHFYFNGKSIGNSTSGVFSVTVIADGMYTCAPINTVGRGDNVLSASLLLVF